MPINDTRIKTTIMGNIFFTLIQSNSFHKKTKTGKDSMPLLFLVVTIFYQFFLTEVKQKYLKKL